MQITSKSACRNLHGVPGMTFPSVTALLTSFFVFQRCLHYSACFIPQSYFGVPLLFTVITASTYVGHQLLTVLQVAVVFNDSKALILLVMLVGCHACVNAATNGLLVLAVVNMDCYRSVNKDKQQ